ncbi:MAG: hypothetical protein C0601_09505 [Candidatus Muiribacterium halophilum]|uniref:Prepilin-type N-terminal cleavage/methylation domain-containing protein n=1 Tax=Muiribacterium halophilum TaxID=2053465 RepID=A0A2N5ZDG1_MUIH1|nr:MAG: hypothetical protein C0601_09505 [Candidatus Muirbacterium halophilum]
MEIRKKGFTLTEVTIVVAVLGVFTLVLFNLLAIINRSSSVVEWRTETNMQLTEAFKILSRDLEQANYPTIITQDGVYRNPISLGAGEYRQGDPLPESILRVHKGSGEVITLPTGVDEITVMMWQINTPEVNIVGRGHAAETTVCILKLYKEFQNRLNVLTYKVIAPANYDYLVYSNSRRIKNNTEIPIIENVKSIEVSYDKKYSDEQINAFNEIKTNPGNFLPEENKDYFHEWMNPGVLGVKVIVEQSRKMGVLMRKREFRVNGEFIIDPLSVIMERVNNF